MLASRNFAVFKRSPNFQVVVEEVVDRWEAEEDLHCLEEEAGYRKLVEEVVGYPHIVARGR
jgi:hypothetical protein